MPITPRHTQQRTKNLILFAALIGLVAILYGVTLLKATL